MKIITKLLFAILAVLGFSSCQGGGLTMYGQPTANFVIRGTVVDKATKAPVEGILVKINNDKKSIYESFLYQTASYGNFYANMQLFPIDMTLRVIWQDIDKGIYKKDSLDIAVKSSDYKGGDGSWYYGEQTKEITIEIEEEKLVGI